MGISDAQKAAEQAKQQEALMRHIEEQVQSRLVNYNLDVQRLLLAAQTLENIAKIKNLYCNIETESNLNAAIIKIENELSAALKFD